jgi:hypothetical protein
VGFVSVLRDECTLAARSTVGFRLTTSAEICWRGQMSFNRNSATM